MTKREAADRLWKLLDEIQHVSEHDGFYRDLSASYKALSDVADYVQENRDDFGNSVVRGFKLIDMIATKILDHGDYPVPGPGSYFHITKQDLKDLS